MNVPLALSKHSFVTGTRQTELFSVSFWSSLLIEAAIAFARFDQIFKFFLKNSSFWQEVEIP